MKRRNLSLKLDNNQNVATARQALEDAIKRLPKEALHFVHGGNNVIP